jgi:hypothetical protein
VEERERERERERENIFLFNFTYCFEFTVIVLNVFGQQSFIPLFFFRTCYKWQDPLSKENVRTSSKVTLLLVVGKKFRWNIQLIPSPLSPKKWLGDSRESSRHSPESLEISQAPSTSITAVINGRKQCKLVNYRIASLRIWRNTRCIRPSWTTVHRRIQLPLPSFSNQLLLSEEGKAIFS